MAGNSYGSLRLDALPPEMAEMILELLEDSTDILNVFQVFSSLNGQVMKKRQKWLMDQVAPLIFPWLNKKEVLNCRLVCWRWSRGIDKFLENSQLNGLHPSREASRAQTELISKLKTFNLLNKSRNYNWKKFQELAGKMENRPSHRNPFIRRKITFYDGGYPNLFVWREAFQFLHEFGAHVWHFKLYYRHVFTDNTCSQNILHCLSLLPNLRRLEIILSNDLELTRKQVQSTVHLPHLEALDVLDSFYSGSAPTICRMIQRYSQQLKSLRMECSSWRMKYSLIFPNLTELTLRECTCTNVRNVWASLNAPNLLRLELDLTINAEAMTVDQFKSSIVSLLQPFGRLISFNVHLKLPHPGIKWSEGTVGPVSSTPVCITSLKSLSVVTWNTEFRELINLEFLKCFPNLSYINVNSKIYQHYDTSRTISLYDRSIWEVGLPKLLELNIGQPGHRYFCLTRAEYEWLAEGRRISRRRKNQLYWSG